MLTERIRQTQSNAALLTADVGWQQSITYTYTKSRATGCISRVDGSTARRLVRVCQVSSHRQVPPRPV